MAARGRKNNEQVIQKVVQIRDVSPMDRKKVHGGKNLWTKLIFSLEWNNEGVKEEESDDDEDEELVKVKEAESQKEVQEVDFREKMIHIDRRSRLVHLVVEQDSVLTTVTCMGIPVTLISRLQSTNYWHF